MRGRGEGCDPLADRGESINLDYIEILDVSYTWTIDSFRLKWGM